MNRLAFYFLVTLITFSLLISAACGGGSSSNQTLSAAQAQAVSQELAAAAQAAIEASATSASDARTHDGFGATLASKTMKDASEVRFAANDSSGCVTSDSGTTCDFPLSYSGSCPQGGTIGVAGQVDFTLNNSGDGSDNLSLTITPTGCAVSSSNSSTLTFNGDPSITLATDLTFQDDQVTFPVTVTEKGGISYGPNPSGSCQVNATLTIASEQSCTVSGTLCGQTLSGNCVPLPPSAMR